MNGDSSKSIGSSDEFFAQAPWKFAPPHPSSATVRISVLYSVGVIVGLDRFKNAQNASQGGIDGALAELRSGRKRGHWIWYIFPQLSGLGSSPMAERYAIADAEEATAYLRDAELAHRLLAATTAVAEQVMKGVPLQRLMASEIDVLKLVSSLTLFECVARRLFEATGDETYQSIVFAAEDVLRAAEDQGVPRCRFTLQRLGAAH
jgi:uncharacterized protein (DUF1810 family)